MFTVYLIIFLVLLQFVCSGAGVRGQDSEERVAEGGQEPEVAGVPGGGAGRAGRLPPPRQGAGAGLGRSGQGAAPEVC